MKMAKRFITKLHKYIIILLYYLKNTRFLLQNFEISIDNIDILISLS